MEITSDRRIFLLLLVSVVATLIVLSGVCTTVVEEDEADLRVAVGSA
jgi:hypothetical protein